MKRATRRQILHLLRTRPQELQEKIGIPGAQLSLPVETPDAGGDRLQVAVPRIDLDRLPTSIVLETPAGPLEILLDPSDAPDTYRPAR